ncbi:50S ribosomal protein L27 [Candidatus Jorgensenbacteria bacterium RIFCSPLOWO2_12_FULL_42_11]|uniref:Large ribosomal subunit protein bL27 n=1 Tax=Candidatus Jorgensenbacteria bacterium RIFCSPLOWO2_12_FULL_42_11 TaxID=1798473 RepID=A0A1F6C215_9BACT|nr:MAG: 50S ribosomal protein L27 [Candidatus Jorgensenbacteria bacterium RIFCSPLOWO2_12_FULL_42_11]
MAHAKAKGSTKLGRDSAAQRLGIKRTDGETVKIGEIIIRQRGTNYFPGLNVRRAGDDTIYSLKKGVVKFVQKKRTRFDGAKHFVKVVNVL